MPRTIRKYCNKVELCVEIMQVNSVTFMTSVSEDVNYSAKSAVDNSNIPSLEVGLKNLVC